MDVVDDAYYFIINKKIRPQIKIWEVVAGILRKLSFVVGIDFLNIFEHLLEGVCALVQGHAFHDTGAHRKTNNYLKGLLNTQKSNFFRVNLLICIVMGDFWVLTFYVLCCFSEKPQP